MPPSSKFPQSSRKYSAWMPNTNFIDIAQSARNSISHIIFRHNDFSNGHSARVCPRNCLPFLLILIFLSLYGASVLLFWEKTEYLVTDTHLYLKAKKNGSGAGGNGYASYTSKSAASAPTKGTSAASTKQSSQPNIVQDHYSVLGVSTSASSREIERAYRTKVLQYHPDKNVEGFKDSKRIIEITNAYEILSNEGKRKAYDMQSKRKKQEKSIDGGDSSTYPQKSTSKKRKAKARDASTSRLEMPKKKPTPKSSHRKNDKPRKSMVRGNKSDRRRIPQDKESPVRSKGSGVAASKGGNDAVEHDSKGEKTGEAQGLEQDSSSVGTVAPDLPLQSTDDVVVGLAVVASVAIAALLGTLAYICTKKRWKDADKAKRRNSSPTQTEWGSESDSKSSIDNTTAVDEVATTQDSPKAAPGNSAQDVEERTHLQSRTESLFSVIVPHHVQPGEDFQVLAGDRVVCVQCPAKSRPGDKVQMYVEEDESTANGGNETQRKEQHLSQTNAFRREDRLANNPQEGSSNMFEVIVPKGIEPGQSFPVIVEGKKIIISCPMNVSAGRKIVFLLPNV